MKYQSLLTIAVATCLFGCNTNTPDPQQTAETVTQSSVTTGLSVSEVATDTQQVDSDTSFVQNFMGNCVLNFSEFERIEAAAVALKWTRITDSATLKTLAPSDGGSDWKAWQFKHLKKGFVLFVGHGSIDNSRVKYCTVSSEADSIDTVISKIADLSKAKAIKSYSENGQRYSFYELSNENKTFYLTFIDGTPMGLKVMSANITGQED